MSICNGIQWNLNPTRFIKYPDLFVELLNRGWSDKNLIGLAGRNFLQVFKAVEDRAKKLQASQTISELPFSPVANRSC